MGGLQRKGKRCVCSYMKLGDEAHAGAETDPKGARTAEPEDHNALKMILSCSAACHPSRACSSFPLVVEIYLVGLRYPSACK